MITQDQVLEALSPYQVNEHQLDAWEEELGLEIPVDQFGNKLYSPLHINLFKNIQKHMTLGRSLKEIKRMVVLPEREEAVSSDEEKIPVGVTQETVQSVESSAETFLPKPPSETGVTNPLSQRLNA